ncbi:MAG: PIN domain-containing protein [Ignavibacteriae bacterium]|nr:PIN domain-containing protein [Ignavibacteriota bacterium]
MKERIYIDTSVIGGCFDKEFKEDSLSFFERMKKRKTLILISTILQFELEDAPKRVKEFLVSLSKDIVEYVSLDDESSALAQAYLDEGAVASKSLSDARHVAIATVNRADVVVSWNFKHIVNVNRIHLYNAVNLKLGYPIIDIRSPKEILYE